MLGMQFHNKWFSVPDVYEYLKCVFGHFLEVQIIQSLLSEMVKGKPNNAIVHQMFFLIQCSKTYV